MGIVSMKRWTEHEVRTWIAQYEAANQDVTPTTRRLLALMILAAKPQVPVVHLEAVLGYQTSNLEDHARRRWLTLATTGLWSYWPTVRVHAMERGTSYAWQYLRQQLTPEQRAQFLRRFGSQPPYNISCGAHNGLYWFKCGTWQKTSIWTTLLIEGETLADRRIFHTQWQERLRPYLRLLERECYALIDPDQVTLVEAKHRVVSYVRRRSGELLGRKQQVGWYHAAWFLCAGIVISDTVWVDWEHHASRFTDKHGSQHAKYQGAKIRARHWR